MKPQDIKSLTSLRFFAAASIVLLHMQNPVLLLPANPELALGVSFFFVLSGFILAYVYRPGFDVPRFYAARFARLWPVHVATLLITVVLITPHLLLRPEWTLPFFANLFLVHAWIPVTGYPFSFNAVSWSISVELLFYILFPLLRGAYFRISLIFLVIFTVSALLYLDGMQFEEAPKLGHFSVMHFILQNPLMRMLEFAVGVGFGKLFIAKKIKTDTIHELAAVAAVVTFAVFSGDFMKLISALGLPNTGWWFSQSGGVLIFATAIYIFAHEAGKISSLLQHRIWVRLGEISFCTYMLHQIVIRYASEYKWADTIGIPLAAIAVLIVTYAGSYTLWSVIEVPCRKAILRQFSKAGSQVA